MTVDSRAHRSSHYSADDASGHKRTQEVAKNYLRFCICLRRFWRAAWAIFTCGRDVPARCRTKYRGSSIYRYVASVMKTLRLIFCTVFGSLAALTSAGASAAALTDAQK